MQPSIDHVIAERSLTATTPSAQSIEIKVQVGAPTRYPDDSGYECPLQIMGPEIDIRQRMGGLDSVQALQAALYIIPFYVRRLCQDRGLADVHWQELGDNFGFPPAAGPERQM